MKAAGKELVGASTAVLVLGVLSRGPSYGYEIVRLLNAEAHGAFAWQEGTVYPVLHKLEQQGLVRCRWRQAPTGRKRKYYALTNKGRDALDAGTRQWGLFHDLIHRIAGATHARATP